jgi:hypothetical protein
MATAHDHVTEAEQLLEAYKAGVRMSLRDGYIYQPGDTLTVARLHVDMAKVRLDLEARAAENARTDRLLAEVKPSPRSLDPRRNRRAAERRLNNKKSPAVASAEDSE